MNRLTIRVAAAAAVVLLASSCSSNDDPAKPDNAGDKVTSPAPSAAAGLQIRPGKDLIAHQGSAIAALDRDTLALRKQVTVPEPVASGKLSGTGAQSRSFSSTYQYALLGSGGMSSDSGTLKVADLTAVGTSNAVVTLSREDLTAAGVKGAISSAQFSVQGSELWFQTTAADAPAGENWTSSTADQYKISSLWSVDIKDWQAGRKTAVKHPVPADVATYWKSQECQTAFSRNAGEESFTPWSCWLLDTAGTPVATGPAADHVTKGSVAAGTGSGKVTFSYVKGSGGKPAGTLSVAGPGGGGASTPDGLSGIVDSGPATQGQRTMWRFTTTGSTLKLTALDTVLPTAGEAKLWAFPDGQAVAKVTDDDTTGWTLTSDGQWKKTGPWPADLADADVVATA
ncbi:hypothetical protein [Streptomyces goshikiensis]|uniref:hypothetical protein n=1 Tax=Streptomyces goshikiensis TaxID=1942 RepID=UPI0036C39928